MTKKPKPKPKSKSNPDLDLAQEALLGVEVKKDGSGVGESGAPAVELFRTFSTAFTARRGNDPFTSAHVSQWSVAYAQLKNRESGDFSLPREFQNTYALGRFMKRNQELLGIVEVGSYGNRTVYALEGELNG